MGRGFSVRNSALRSSKNANEADGIASAESDRSDGSIGPVLASTQNGNPASAPIAVSGPMNTTEPNRCE